MGGDSKRRISNRQSAIASRERRRQYMEDLIRRNTQLEEENCRLRRQVELMVPSAPSDPDGAHPAGNPNTAVASFTHRKSASLYEPAALVASTILSTA